jgi:ABC-2 type transport system permease protein
VAITRALGAFLLRDWRTTRSYRAQWGIQVFGALFQLAIYYYLSRIVDEPAITVGHNRTVDYFAFVVIGLGLYGFLTAGLGVFANSIRSEQNAGTLEVLLSVPTPPSVTLFGSGIYGFMWSLGTTTVMFGVAIVVFGLRPVLEPMVLLGATIALVASVALFVSLGIVAAAIALVYKRTLGFMELVTQGLALFGGVYFPIDLLPKPLEAVARAIPLTWSLDVLRQSLLAGEVDGSRILTLVMTSAILIPAAIWIFHRAVNRARKDGSLAHY